MTKMELTDFLQEVFDQVDSLPSEFAEQFLGLLDLGSNQKKKEVTGVVRGKCK